MCRRASAQHLRLDWNGSGFNTGVSLNPTCHCEPVHTAGSFEPADHWIMSSGTVASKRPVVSTRRHRSMRANQTTALFFFASSLARVNEP
jgi:hypothetical protein